MNHTQNNRKQLVTAGIWSLAVFALLAVGTMTLFSAASRKTKTQTDKAEVTAAVTEDAETQIDTEDAGLFDFHPANPADTEIPDVESQKASPTAENEPAKEQPVNEEPVIDDAMTAPTAAFDNGDHFVAVMPVNGEIAKAFTEDVAVYSLTMNDYRVHQGIDIAAPVGTSVCACAAGVIERVWLDPFLGQCVEINHGGEIRSRYANLSADLPRGIEAGATVLSGDVIGGIGETMILEMADTDHLHFSLTVDGIPVNPTDYMK